MSDLSSTGVSNRPGRDDESSNPPRRSRSPEQIRDELVDTAAIQAPDCTDLLYRYYRLIPAEEVIGATPADLAGAVRAHLQLAQQRVPGRPVIRMFNPTVAGDGWTREATVLQLIADDMPYLVDSVAAELSRHGARVRWIVHPVMMVHRAADGELLEVFPQADVTNPPAGATSESWIYLETDPISDPERIQSLSEQLAAILDEAREVAEDTEAMVATATGIADALEVDPPGLPAEEVQEGSRLLRWLAAGHFTFLGYRRYELMSRGDPAGEPTLRPVPDSGLGVLREDDHTTRALITGPDSASQMSVPSLLVLTQASAPPTVYRPICPYHVGVKTFDGNGNVSGEHCFVGVFTTSARYTDVLNIPVVERRAREVVHRAGFSMESYSGRQMLEVLQNWPLADLLSADADSLYASAIGAVTLADRRGLRLFLRRDRYGRFYSCLVFLPQDRYTTRARIAMQEVLLSELDGTHVEHSPQLGENSLAQVHFTVHTNSAPTVEPDTLHIQERLNAALCSWEDLMVEAVLAERGHHVGNGPAADAEDARDAEGKPGEAVRPGAPAGMEAAMEQGYRFAAVFPQAYREEFTAATALADLRTLEALSGPDGFDVSFYQPEDALPGEWRFKLFLLGEGVTLSKLMPVLQHMDVEVVDQRPYQLERADGSPCWIYDFRLRLQPQIVSALDDDVRQDLRERFEAAFAASWRGEAEVDGFNALILRTGLTWRQVAVLRAYSRYLRQAGTTYSQEHIENTLLAHTDITTALIRLFEARFDPANSRRAERVTEQVAEITALIDTVTSLDTDRILRRLMSVILATLRTNYWMRDADGNPRTYLAFKLDPQEILGLPEPRPTFETFVYSPRVEGVHLRFGAVARGGLRWSDRLEDFRTEALGLAKTQAVKNALIVPAGAKGGFVVKQPPAPTGDPQHDRDAYQAEGIACYRLFISGLLDLTDNLVAGETVAAPDVVRHDGDDTYMVVAADKGTATFSDIANDVAAEYNFWLGDAFASGGSQGYDHKAMAITARGAWESVKRHFRELGVDTQTQDFTVVGIGDMAGDVFGNGMLRSKHIRLVAAFNHLHIFLDPSPDAAASYEERQRLFHLPGSSWEDYDRSLLSAGGGIYSRSARSIPITSEVRVALGLPDGTTEMTPPDLVHAILTAPVDLLWNGGIGTYVKAETESHAEVGDRANDAVRANGSQLRAKVVGEGGNLGFTQRGRIEFARTGGKINTDAIDNSAGVNSSDSEVNIKIMLDRLVAAGELDRARRNAMLEQMTDEVADLVLANNSSQNAVLGVSRAHAPSMLSVHRRLITALEAKGALDRDLEALPDEDEFAAREQAGLGLTSPELAAVLAHVKLDLKGELLSSDLPDADVFVHKLPEYFPTLLSEHYPAALKQHPLRREITTTLLVNEVVDSAGTSYVFRLAEELNVTAADAVRAYAVVTAVYDLPAVWRAIAALDQVPVGTTDRMVLETRRLLDRAARWFLTNRPQPLAVDAEIGRFSGPMATVLPGLVHRLPEDQALAVHRQTEQLTTQGVPEELAHRIALLLFGYCLLDIIEIAELATQEVGLDPGHSPAETAELYYALSDHVGIERMLLAVNALERGTRWDALARLALRDDLYASLRAITLDALRRSDSAASVEDRIAQWEQANVAQLARARATLDELDLSDELDLAPLSVATRQIRNAVR